MDKVKLPKKVAEAIEEVRSTYISGIEFDLEFMKKEDTLNMRVICDYADEERVNMIRYFSALVNGYEVEMTPEEKVWKAYHGFLDENLEPLEYGLMEHNEFKNGMRTAINILGIKIKGVNAE